MTASPTETPHGVLVDPAVAEVMALHGVPMIAVSSGQRPQHFVPLWAWIGREATCRPEYTITEAVFSILVRSPDLQREVESMFRLDAREGLHAAFARLDQEWDRQRRRTW